MKTIKCMLFILMISFSATSFAAPAELGLKDPLSEEISKMLSNSKLVIEEDFTVEVLFTVTQEMTIAIRSINSSNETVNKFLFDRLQGQQLKGSNWFSGKIYQLPVRVRATR